MRRACGFFFPDCCGLRFSSERDTETRAGAIARRGAAIVCCKSLYCYMHSQRFGDELQ